MYKEASYDGFLLSSDKAIEKFIIGWHREKRESIYSFWVLVLKRVTSSLFT